jgi:hypothetical protein
MEQIPIYLKLVVEIASFLFVMFGVYMALDRRITTLETQHKGKVQDFDEKILQLRQDMKEQMTFFREELKNHSVVYTENLDSMRKEHKELTSSVRQLNDTLIKLQATMEFIPKK